MGDIIGLGPYVNIGGWLLVVVLIIISWIRGLLYPAKQVNEIIKVYERLLQDKDDQISDWKEAYKNSDARGDILAKNQEDLLGSVKTIGTLVQTVISAGSTNTREPTR